MKVNYLQTMDYCLPKEPLTTSIIPHFKTWDYSLDFITQDWSELDQPYDFIVAESTVSVQAEELQDLMEQDYDIG